MHDDETGNDSKKSSPDSEKTQNPEMTAGEVAKKVKTPAEKQKQMLSVSETAEMFGISAKTLRTWCKRGLIAYYETPHGQRRFSYADVMAYLEKNHFKPKGYKPPVEPED